MSHHWWEWLLFALFFVAKLLWSGRQICRMDLLVYTEFTIAVLATLGGLRWVWLGPSNPHPSFFSSLGTTFTQNTVNECIKPALKARMPHSPLSRRLRQGNLTVKLHCKAASTMWAQKKLPFCTGRDLRYPVPMAGARGINIQNSQFHKV